MLNLTFPTFPNLQTSRLRLRQLRKEDAPEILILRSDPIILEHIPIKKASSLNDALEYIEMINEGVAKGEWILWGITTSEEDKLIGSICFWNVSKEAGTGEIGYVLLPAYHRKGLMTEAVVECLNFGFKQIQFKGIDAVLTPKNVNSVGLLKKVGFVLDEGFEKKGEVRYCLMSY